MKQSIILPAFVIACSMTTVVSGIETVKAPSGWEDSQVGGQRVVGNGNATVTVGAWQDLNGRSIGDWLSDMAEKAPDGGTITSSEPARPERVDGAWSITRKAQFTEQSGYSILYACPGQPGHARVLILDVRNGSFGDTLKGAIFGENLCRNERRGRAAVADTAAEESLQSGDGDNYSSSSNGNVSGKPLEAVESPGVSGESDLQPKLQILNQQIPVENRPVDASMYIDRHFKGFPAVLVHEPVMVVTFKDGTDLGCTDLNPLNPRNPVELKGLKGCAVPAKKAAEKLWGFNPGEKVTVGFGRISALGIDSGSGSASSISGGDLLMSQSGEISVGQWQVNHASAEAASARATSARKSAFVGRYYLDGHTITIVANDGEVLHGYIGYSKDQTGGIRSIYLNGKRYWERE